jgi:winged helix DNA-binding protein
MRQRSARNVWRAQLLTGRAPDPVEVVERLVVIQAQDTRAARLAIRARSTGVTLADVDEACGNRALITTWLQRGTLHLVRTEDYWWLHPLVAPRAIRSSQRRLADDPARADDCVVAALEGTNGLRRDELRHRLGAAGVRVAGQAFIHCVCLASLEGLVVQGPVRSGEHLYVLAREWLPRPPEPLDRPAACERLVQRYLRAHPGGGEDDIAAWSGLPRSELRPHLTRQPKVRASSTVRPPRARLLGAFDPLLLGWRDRKFLLGADTYDIIRGGMIRPVVLVDGLTVGTWSVRRGEIGLDVAEQADATARALRREAADVERFLGTDAASRTSAFRSPGHSAGRMASW